MKVWEVRKTSIPNEQGDTLIYQLSLIYSTNTANRQIFKVN